MRAEPLSREIRHALERPGMDRGFQARSRTPVAL